LWQATRQKSRHRPIRQKANYSFSEARSTTEKMPLKCTEHCPFEWSDVLTLQGCRACFFSGTLTQFCPRHLSDVTNRRLSARFEPGYRSTVLYSICFSFQQLHNCVFSSVQADLAPFVLLFFLMLLCFLSFSLFSVL